MPQYLTPGVYIEEIPGAKPIEGVGTATGAFVGISEKGPIGNAELITNWTQFVEKFAGKTVAPAIFWIEIFYDLIYQISKIGLFIIWFLYFVTLRLCLSSSIYFYANFSTISVLMKVQDVCFCHRISNCKTPQLEALQLEKILQ